jgi:hypothetical protein
MKKPIIVLIIALILLGLAWLAWGGEQTEAGNANGDNGTMPADDSSVSNGQVAWTYPDNFGLAVTNEQLRGIVKSYIPPCDENFDYCMYYNGDDFAGTNFESAGVRVKRRNDLATERLCLNTPPAGRTNIGNSSTSTGQYSASIFSPLSDAATGHYSNGELYRVYLRQANTCMEFETSIGETQIANMATSTRRFSEADRDKVYDGFRSILASLRVASTDESIRLPDSEN